jgi:ABC-type multidrug transport system ATPase subunit
VEGLSVGSQMSEVRSLMGVCPQFDVLWARLTAREHLQLYAEIKVSAGGAFGSKKV